MNRLFLIGALVFNLLGTSFADSTDSDANAVISKKIVDLRSDKSPAPKELSDDKQQTQLLFGEPIRVLENAGAYTYIEAVEQPEYTTNKVWEGYKGWIPSDSFIRTDTPLDFTDFVLDKWLPVFDQPRGELELTRLPMGARVRVASLQDVWAQVDLLDGKFGWVLKDGLLGKSNPLQGRTVRQQIIKSAEQLIGDPYVWGGRSPTVQTFPKQLSGVDCSGLVHLAYQAVGARIPRDAQEQFLRAQRISRKQLLPGDLVFTASLKTPKKIAHVMMYKGNEQLIEAPQSGETVQDIAFRDKIGASFNTVDWGSTVQERYIYFGRLLKDAAKPSAPKMKASSKKKSRR